MAAAGSWCARNVFLLLITTIFAKCYAEDILGCGGFVKSHVPLDYAQIVIGLYTKAGILKEQTECAPTNGYYFLPLYEKGEYVLKVQPPSGWSFEPSQVELTVDGVSDKCSTSEDINFAFNGFGITGKVTSAEILNSSNIDGPAGITVKLINDKGEIRKTNTESRGHFHFTPVIPGHYILKATHSLLKLDPATVEVNVEQGNTVLPVGSLMVKGYEVKGTVISYTRAPIPGVYVVLFGAKFHFLALEDVPYPKREIITLGPGISNDLIYRLLQGDVGVYTHKRPMVVLGPGIRQRDAVLLKRYKSVTGHPSITDCLKGDLALEGGSGICHSISNANGEFSFGLLPVGDYELLALTKPPGAEVDLFRFEAERLAFKVENSSLHIAKAFQVGGWTVLGHVLTSKDGVGLPDVKVLKQSPRPRPVFTNSNGLFALPSLIHGTYNIAFVHDKCKIDDVQVTVTPTGGPGPLTVIVSQWLVEGTVTPTSPGEKRYVTITTTEYKPVATVLVNKGGWQVFLPPGDYVISVKVEEKEGSLVFFPQESKVTVKDGPIEGIMFSQLKAKVSGVVECIDAKACEGLTITLRPLSADGGYLSSELTTTAKSGEYELKNVLPGSVEVSVPTKRLCWRQATHSKQVTGHTVRMPPFRHTGYVVPMRSTHQVKVEFDSGTAKGYLEVPAGDSIQCLPRAAQFTLTPTGPHRFDPTEIVVSTINPVTKPIKIVAVEHAVTIRVYTGLVAVNDIMVNVVVNSRDTMYGPLELEGTDYSPEPSFLYTLSVFLKEGDQATFTVMSDSALIDPPGPQQVTGAGDAEPFALSFAATPALTISGRIEPPVENVELTLISGDLILKQNTSGDGKYSFGPLDATKKYNITARKPSYAFSERNETTGVISSQRLAEITVKLSDVATGEPLQGVLVSVSGGSYRSNAVSGPDGHIHYKDLATGSYYIKSNMKEYRFTPPHSIINVVDDKEYIVVIKGVRVGWSVAGRLMSAAGVGWAGCRLRAEAPPPQPADCRHEETVTDHDGAFRIRGLLPGCDYTMELKECSNDDLKELKLFTHPKKIGVDVNDRNDIENIKLIGLLPEKKTDVNVRVYTPDVEFYKYLYLTIASEHNPNSNIIESKYATTGFTQNNNPGIMVALPPLPADNSTFIIELKSSLSKATHVYDDMVYHLRSDGEFKYHTFEFNPKLRTSEQDLKQTSVLVVPLLGILLVAWYYRSRLYKYFFSRYQRSSRPPPPRQGHQHQPHQVLDKASIKHILSTINPPKKTKKKTQ